MINIILILTLFTIKHTHASIHDTDDRLEYYELNRAQSEIAQASVALIEKSKLIFKDGHYRLAAMSLEDSLDYCPESLFSDQPSGAFCSGALVKNDVILTAAHCIWKKNNVHPKDLYVVFNYKKDYPDQEVYTFSKEDVFEIEDTIHYEFDENFNDTMLDLALYRLTRKAPYKPAKVSFEQEPIISNKVYAFGYPLGIPFKLAENGSVTKIVDQNSFQFDLDLFSVNSGSPVFNSKHEIIGVYVRGTGNNFTGKNCKRWFEANSTTDYEEANSVRSLMKYFN